MARSNRQITQAMVDHLYRLRFFLSSNNLEVGNTAIEYAEDSNSGWRRCTVKLFGEPIFDCTAKAADISSIAFLNGNFFDGKGRPSRTTRERINGVLAHGGELGTIPEGVRCFINKETGQCCVGKGDHCRLLDKDHPAVYIQPNPAELVFL